MLYISEPLFKAHNLCMRGTGIWKRLIFIKFKIKIQASFLHGRFSRGGIHVSKAL